MDSLVVTLETAQRLKAAGFPQETFYAYDDLTGGGFAARPRNAISAFYRDGQPCAPTAQELADQLPWPPDGEETATGLIYRTDHLYMAQVKPFGATTFAPTIVEALAALWLKLKEADHE